MQGIHCTSDAPYVLERLGPRRAQEGAYVWQKLVKSGAIIAKPSGISTIGRKRTERQPASTRAISAMVISVSGAGVRSAAG